MEDSLIILVSIFDRGISAVTCKPIRIKIFIEDDPQWTIPLCQIASLSNDP